ncbi:MAG: proton-conducting transporter membrane subunit [Pseudomonadota bacterium]
MANAPYPLLSTLQCLPLLGALLLFLWRGQADKQHGRASTLAIWLGRFIALLELFLVLDLYRRLDASNPQLQFAEHLPSLGYHVAADGLTVLFMLLTALTTVLLSFYGMAREHLSPARLISILLLIEATLMSLLSTLNLLWFAAAASLQLILISYLLWRWASAEAERQALSRFLQYQLLGCALFMAGVVVLGWNHADKHAGAWHFDLFELMQTPPSSTLQSLAFFLLFYGLAIRTPLFPLHGWLPNTARHGLVAVGPILLLGVKIGIYGMARFVLPLTPWAVVHWQPYVIAFATAGIFYAATLALLQTNLRRLMAFCVVSHSVELMPQFWFFCSSQPVRCSSAMMSPSSTSSSDPFSFGATKMAIGVISALVSGIR